MFFFFCCRLLVGYDCDEAISPNMTLLLQTLLLWLLLSSSSLRKSHYYTRNISCLVYCGGGGVSVFSLVILHYCWRYQHEEYLKSVLSYNSSLPFICRRREAVGWWYLIDLSLFFSFLAYLNKTKVSVVIVVLAIAPSHSTCTLTKKLLQHVHLSSRESDDDKNDKNIVMQLKGLLLYFLVDYHRKKMSHFLSRGNH